MLNGKLSTLDLVSIEIITAPALAKNPPISARDIALRFDQFGVHIIFDAN